MLRFLENPFRFALVVLTLACVAVVAGGVVMGAGGQRAFQGTAGVPSRLMFEIAAGNVLGFSSFDKFGLNGDVDTGAPEDIWGGGGIYTGFPTGSAETMEILSSDVDDTSAGTGAQTAIIQNLIDSTGAASPDITVSLNGTTPVSLGAITYLRASRVKVITAGASAGNEGTLTVRHTTTTANIFAVMPVGLNQTAIAAYTVPLGKTLYINNVTMQLTRISGAAGSATMSIRARKPGEVFQTIVHPGISQAQSYTLNTDVLHIFTAGTDIKITCEDSTDLNTTISGDFSGFLVDD